MAAWLTVKKYGVSNCSLVFTDTKTEDPDLYRFLEQTHEALGCDCEVLADGRHIWEVFRDVRFQGNSRIDPCSRILKRDLFRKWVDTKYGAENAVIVFGIGKDEAHRMNAIRERWAPYQTEAPLIESPRTREQILDLLDELNIEPPRLYELGFPHNNCGGLCVKTGQKQMKLLLEKLPDVYAWHEAEQERLFTVLGKRHGFIRKVIDGEMQYLGLREFREMLERGESCDMYDAKGCGCFV